MARVIGFRRSAGEKVGLSVCLVQPPPPRVRWKLASINTETPSFSQYGSLSCQPTDGVTTYYFTGCHSGPTRRGTTHGQDLFIAGLSSDRLCEKSWPTARMHTNAYHKFFGGKKTRLQEFILYQGTYTIHVATCTEHHYGANPST